MDELLRAAIADAQDTSTRIIAAELQISGVPITEVDYQYRDQGQRLYLIGQDSEVVGNWTLYNPERIALVAIGIVAVLAMLVFALLVFF
jgi:hypothetical protein